MRELQSADRLEARRGKKFNDHPTATNGRAYSEAAVRVEDWSMTVDRITTDLARRVEKEERARMRRRSRERPLRESEEEEELPSDFDTEWEFSCEYLAGEASSNVDINFRLRRNDGRAFGYDEAKRAMSTFRAQLSAGIESAPPGYRIAGIDWRRPSKGQTAWTRHGQFPRNLEGLSAVIYVASDHPSLWSVTEKPKWRIGSGR